MIPVDRYCRTCLKELNDLAESLRKHFITPDIADKLVCCTMIGVEVNDEFPKHLCDCCFDQLEKFDAFRLMCHESVTRFRKILTTSTNFIKIEADVAIEEVPLAEPNADIVKEEVNYLENSTSLLEIEMHEILTEKVDPVENPLEIQNKRKRSQKRPPAKVKNKKDERINSKSTIKDEKKISVDRLQRSKTDVERESEDQKHQNNDENLALHPETEVNELSIQKADSIENLLEIPNKRKRSQKRTPAKVKSKKSDLISSKSVIKEEKNTSVGRLQHSKPVIETESEDQLQQTGHENLISLAESEGNELSSEIIDTSTNSLGIQNKRKSNRKRAPTKAKSKKDDQNNSKSVQSEEKQPTIEVESRDQKQQKDDEINSSKSSKTFQCDLCSQRFYAEHKLIAHRRKHDGLIPYPCPRENCDRGFASFPTLQHHLNKHEGTINWVSCKEPGCNRRYTQSSALKFHLRRYHKKGLELKTYVCEVCGKVFKSSSAVCMHRFIHKDMSELPFECKEPECKMRFYTKRRLNEHMMRHAGIKKFECSICGIRKTTDVELNKHMNYHTSARQYPCRICSHVFLDRGNLKRHVHTVHEGAKDFACRYCDRKFGQLESRKQHEMTHTGEKPRECSVCGKGFIQSTALRTHLKTHFRDQTDEMFPRRRRHRKDAGPKLDGESDEQTGMEENKLTPSCNADDCGDDDDSGRILEA